MKTTKSSCGCGGGGRTTPEYSSPAMASRIPGLRQVPKPGHPVSAPAETLFFSNVQFNFPRGSFRAL